MTSFSNNECPNKSCRSKVLPYPTSYLVLEVMLTVIDITIIQATISKLGHFSNRIFSIPFAD